MDALSSSPFCKHALRNGVRCPTLMTLVELVVFVIDIDARFATTNQPPLSLTFSQNTGIPIFSPIYPVACTFSADHLG